MNHESTTSASEVRCFSRTSVSIDEAVAMLLGGITGPVELRSNNQWPSGEEEAEIDAYYFDLDYRLHEIREGLDADLSWAKHEGRQSEVERLSNELGKLKNYETSAFAYRCAIDDELHKGTESELRVDSALSNDVFTYITLASFDQWAKKRYNRQFLDLPQQSSEGPHLPSEAKTAKARTRSRDQERAILACLSELGHNPKKLPKNRPGKPGVKKEVRDRLAGNPLLKGSKVFDNAWERLQKYNDIAYA
jgi:hypothetical protein